MCNKLFTLAVSTVFAASAWAADASTRPFSRDDMMKELQALRVQATQVASLAKNKRSTALDVRPAAEAAHDAAVKLRSMVERNPELFGPAGSEQLEQFAMGTQVMAVVASNKLGMIADYDTKGNRQAVRAKARNLADRAQRMERSISGRT